MLTAGSSASPWRHLFHDPVAKWLEHHRLEELIDEAVDSALKRSEGNISQAARLLGISRRQLEYRHKKPKA